MKQEMNIALKVEKNGMQFQFLFPNQCQVDDLRNAATEMLAAVFEIIKQHTAAQEQAAQAPESVTPEVVSDISA
jgi:hypothetical protein